MCKRFISSSMNTQKTDYSLHRLLLCILLIVPSVVKGDGLNMCPGELPKDNARYLMGYRMDKDTCISYVKINTTGWSESLDFEDLWHKLCMPVRGKPYLVFTKENISTSWITKDINITSLSGWYTTNINKTHEWICWTIWYCYMHKWDVHGFFDYKSNNLTMQQLESYIYLLRSTWKWIKDHKTHPYLAQTVMADQYIHDWSFRFTRTFSPHNPYLYLHGIENGEVIIKVPIIASNISSDPGRPHYVACIHPAPKSCIQSVVLSCNFNRKLGKWIDKMVVVKQMPDLPLGTPCAEVDFSQNSKPCTQTCSGHWSAFSAEPQHKCDKAIVQRFRPAEKNDPPCNFPSTSCCVEEKEIAYDYKCSDFAFNTTINLKKDGCMHNVVPVMGAMGYLECPCPQRYSGIRCELDTCAHRCANYEDCLLLTGMKALCICKLGFEGPLCEEATQKCGKNGACSHGGTCMPASKDAGPYCVCATGYAGENCEQKVRGCDALSCSGNGICYPDLKRKYFKCYCNTYFTGSQCEINLTPEAKKRPAYTEVASFSIGEMVGIVIAFLLLLILLALVFRSRRRRYRRRKHGSRLSSSEIVSVGGLSSLIPFRKGRSSQSMKSTSRSSMKSKSKSTAKRYKK